MGIPRAVQRKADKARELMAQSHQPNAQAPVAPSPNQAPQAPPPAPVEVPQQEGDPSGHEQEGEGMRVGIALDDWEGRYKNLRAAGNEGVKKLQRRVSELEAENADYRRQLADQASSRQPAPSPFELSKEEREALSDDGAAAYELAAKKLGGQLKQSETDDAAAREAAFFADVESAVPNWEAINADSGYINWLKAEDGFSGRTRLQTLQSARNDLDARTVVSLFRAYEGEVTRGGSANNGASAAAQATVVEPGRGSTVSDPRSNASDASRRVIPQAEVKEFYRQRNELQRRRKLVGDVAEQYAAREAEIRKAHQEGRIR